MASKYQGALFCSPFSSISPPSTDFAEAQSFRRVSASSVSHYQFDTMSGYKSMPMSRSSSTQSTTHSTQAPTSSPMRRSSSSSSTASASTWSASPYRSCLTPSFEEPSSYLSDDDLLSLNLPVESIPNLERRQRREMTTEEQIEHLRQIQEEEERDQESRRSSSTHSSKKTVRFEEVSRKPRRPSQLKRRNTGVRRGLSTLNGPM